MSEGALTYLGAMYIPPRMHGDVFDVSNEIQEGTPGFQGVGPKLHDEISSQWMEENPGCLVLFFRANAPVAENIPPALFELGPDYMPGIDLSSLYRVLTVAPEDVRDFLPTGSQLGVLTALKDRDATLRVKIDWEKGHFLGLRPVLEGWTWSEGTIFLVTMEF